MLIFTIKITAVFDMTVITVDGQIGAGAHELGKRVAKMVDFQYVDRIALPRSMVQSEQASVRGFTDRFWSVVERAVSGFALGNAAGDPYFNVPEVLILPLTWDTTGPSEQRANESVNDISGYDSLFDHGNAVLVHRAGCLEVSGRPAIKVGLFASWEDRISRIMKREGLLSEAAAEDVIQRREVLQRKYFGDLHGVNPEDRNLYDITIDTSLETIPLASLKVARFARQVLALS